MKRTQTYFSSNAKLIYNVSQASEHIQSHVVNSDWIADERKALGEFELTIFCDVLSVLCPQGDQRQFYLLFYTSFVNYMKRSRIEAV